MAKSNREADKLPDQLLVRYFRAGEIEAIKTVTVAAEKIRVQMTATAADRLDSWIDLGGGLGFVPDPEG